MEVTSLNFKDSLSSIKEVIDNSTFLAIDCELSGLNVVSEVNAFDTPKQYYEKVRRNCKDFLVLQYGISAFRFDLTTERFNQQSYNFYIFRKPQNHNIPDQRFLCQTSSIGFLISQNFDFNKLFQYGISYMNIDEETDYKKKLQERQKLRSNNNSTPNNTVISIPDDVKPTVDKIMGIVQEFIESNDDEIELPKCNAYVRRLIYQSTAEKYKEKINLQTKIINKERILVAAKFKSAEQKQEDEKKQHEEEMEAAADFLGFTKVLRFIIDSGKLIVGHNMCLDLLHTIDKFLTPLPDDYNEFKACTQAVFKNIIDTKLISSSDQLKDLIQSTILKDLLATISKKPFEIPENAIEENGQGYRLDDDKEHEAGYDAFITGVCLLSMWKYLGKLKGLSTSETFSDFSVLTPYMNKLFVMRLKDYQYINLGGPDLKPSRDHVLHLTFPKDWKLNDITELFSPFGNVYVAWINETSAYVGLFQRDQASVALRTLSQSDRYSIMSYKKHQLLLSGVKKPLSSQMPTKKRRNSREIFDVCNKKIPRTDKVSKLLPSMITPIIESIESENNTTTSSFRTTSTSQMFTESDAWD